MSGLLPVDGEAVPAVGEAAAGEAACGAMRVEVGGEAPYQVVIGTGLSGELAGLLAGAQRVAVVHQPTVRAAAGEIHDGLAAAGFEPHLIEVPDGEDAKTIEVAGRCWDTLGGLGFTRSDA